MNENSSARLYRGLFFGVVLVGVGAVCFQVMRPFYAAIAWATVLAVGFQPPWRWLERRLSPRRTLAAALAASLIALVVLLPAVVMGSILAGQAARAVTDVAEEMREQQVSSLADVMVMPAVEPTLKWIEEKSGITSADVLLKAKQLAANASAFVAQTSGKLVLSLFDMVLTFATTIFLLFFFLRDGAEMARAASDLMPLAYEERDRVMDRLRLMLQAIFRGSLLCALIQGVIGGAGWAMAGLPSAALAGAFMGIFSLLPIGGTALVWLPGAVWLWFAGHHAAAIFLVVWGVLVTSFLADNVLKPILIRGQELDTLVVFLGVFGGLSAFGLLGLFIGPIALAAAVSVLNVLRESARLARVGIVPAPDPSAIPVGQPE